MQIQPNETEALALVFPGQGSQRPGMARDFHDVSPDARAVFEEASDALGLDLRALCFSDDPRLDQTEFTQPAILTAEIAMVRALTEEFGIEPDCFGGHSLGEYTALCAAGALPLATAVRLVRRRGALMQAAVPAGQGAMVAVIADGLTDDPILGELARLGVDVANRNAPDQIVVSGAASSVEKAATLLAAHLQGREHRLVTLNVSAPFHSASMRIIEEPFRAELDATAAAWFPARASRVVSNLTGGWHGTSLSSLFDALTGQLAGTVDWLADMEVLAQRAPRILEIGPSRVLRSFFGKVGREIASISTVRGAQKELA